MQEQKPATLPPIKITITPDDFKDISDALKSLAETDRQRLGDAIRDQDIQTLTAADREFISVVAYFAKITDQARDKKLIKKTLFLDDPDLAYLIENAAPPDGIIRHITSYTITGKAPEQAKPAETAPETETAKPADDQKQMVQDELFPDLKPDPPPTFAVNYDEQNIHSDKANVSISKVAQKITAVINKEITPIIVSPRTQKKQILTNVTLSLDMPQGVQIMHPITFYDRIVEDAIGNLFDQGFSKITPEMVYRQLNGTKGAKQVSQTAADKIDRSIRRLARTWITIDFTDQLQALTKDKLQKGEIQGNIVNANNILLKFADGTVKSGWQIKDAPKVYTYSKIIRQIATIPTALLDTTQATRSTEEIIAARYYLIAQIERIRRKPDNPKILFDSLFKAIGDKTALENREIKRRRIVAITAILEHFKTLQYITNFEITEERGGRTDGVIITAPPKQNAIEGK